MSETRSSKESATAAIVPSPVLARILSHKLFRYGLAAVGPIGTAGAQFVLSLVLLHTLAPAMFGGFSFLLVTSQFSTGVWSALFCAPMPLLLSRGTEAEITAVRRCLMASNLVLSIGAFAAFTLAGVLLDTPLIASLLFAGYAAVMLLRWFARAYAYAIGGQVRTMTSDVVYSLSLLAAVGVVTLVRPDDLILPYGGLLAASLLGLAPFGLGYLRQQFIEVAPSDISRYPAIWKAHSGWSLTGVLTTEATVNAHAYIVTLFAGAASFAPLAASALLMRPIGVATNALTEFERPQMARQVAAGRIDEALKATVFFRVMLVAAWFGTLALAVVLYHYVPQVLFPADYDGTYLMIGTALWLAVAVVRLLRAPESVLLQAAGEFRALAHASMISCGVSIVAVGVLLLVGGPLWSIIGIFVGEAVFAAWIWRQKLKWKARATLETHPDVQVGSSPVIAQEVAQS